MSHRVHQLVRALELTPHPEGGWYREVFRAAASVDPLDGRPRRSALTGIYFLLASGQHSRWHRVDSDEVWCWIEGGPVRIWRFDPERGALDSVLAGPLGEGAEPIRTVEAGVWQAAEPVGEYAFGGCFVGPGFDFADFRMLDSDPETRRRLAEISQEHLRLA